MTSTITFKPGEVSDLRLGIRSSLSSPFRVVVRGDEVQVDFTAPLDSSSARVYVEKLAIQTSSTRTPEIVIPLSASVEPVLSVRPSVVIFAVSPPSGTTFLELSSRYPFAIDSMRATFDADEKQIPNLESVQSKKWSSNHRLAIASETLSNASNLTIQTRLRKGFFSRQSATIIIPIKKL